MYKPRRTFEHKFKPVPPKPSKPKRVRPESTRETDMQCLRQAAASVARAIELFVNKTDEDCAAQANLAKRFLEEFLDKRG